MLENRPLILWDLDGTILDASLGILPALEEAFQNRGFAVPEAPVLRRFIGPQILDSLALYTDIPVEYHHEILGEFKMVTYPRHYKNAQLYPGMLELHTELQELGALQGIASQKPEHLVIDVLKSYGLEHLFYVVSGSADDFGQINSHLPRDKPGILRRALSMATSKADVSSSVMVGDRAFDAEAAVSASIPFIGVNWGYASEGELEQFKCPVAADVQELRTLLLTFIQDICSPSVSG